jgi:hypothetical protein
MREAVFLRLLAARDKEAALTEAVVALRQGAGHHPAAYRMDPEHFREVPGSPFAYWVSERFREAFVKLPSLEGSGRTVKVGLQTSDDFRFLRAWWEVPEERSAHSAAETREGKPWVPFAKGGDYSPYYADVYLLVDWGNEGERIKSYVCLRYPYLKGKWEWVVKNLSFYFRPGLTYSRVTVKGLNVRLMPEGCIFADKGPALFFADEVDRWYALGLLNTRLTRAFLQVLTPSRSWEVGYVQRLPWASPPAQLRDEVARLARECHDRQRELDGGRETSREFLRPFLARLEFWPEQFSLEGTFRRYLQWREANEAALLEASWRIEAAVLDLYQVDAADRAALDAELGPHPGALAQRGLSAADAAALRRAYLSREAVEETGDGEEGERPARGKGKKRRYLELGELALTLGCAPAQVAAWRLQLGLVRPEELEEQAVRLASYALGVAFGRFDLRGGGLLGPVPGDYPLEVSPDGLLADDPGHPWDLGTRLSAAMEAIFGSKNAPRAEEELCALLKVKHLRDFFRDRFFRLHLGDYSRRPRKAPIYWQLSSPRRAYSIWLYYPRLTGDTVFRILRDFVEPKQHLEERHLQEFQERRRAAEEGSPREAKALMQREVEAEHLLEELASLRRGLEEVAALHLSPDPDDGVVLNAAAFHGLLAWPEADKKWGEISAGNYPWAAVTAQVLQAAEQRDPQLASKLRQALEKR